MPNRFDGTQHIRLLQLGATLIIGGSERCFVTIGKGLDSHRYRSLFAGLGEDGRIGEMLRQEGYVAEAFKRSPGFDRSLFGKVRAFLKRYPVDVIQTHHISSLIYGGPPGFLSGAKIIHTEHDVHNFENFPSNKRWLKRLCRIPSAFVAIDPTIAEYLKREIGIHDDRIRVIRNGVDFARFTPASMEERQARREFRVGWLARLAPPKRPDLLLDAVASLATSMPELRLTMVGEGELLEPLKKAAIERRIDSIVDFTGPRFDVPELLRSFDLYVLTTDMEGLPISIIEAMGSGLPVIASAVGGIPGFVKHDHNGFLLERASSTELASMIKSLAAARDVRYRIGGQAREDALSTYGADVMIRKYDQLFQHVMFEARENSSQSPRTAKRMAVSSLHFAGADRLARARNADKLLIVNYHGVGDVAPEAVRSWVLAPKVEFEKQIRYLVSNYHIIKASEAVEILKRGGTFDRPTACVTFDDGYRNNANEAYDVLKKYDVPATIFLATGFIGVDRVIWALIVEHALLETNVDQIDLSDFELGVFKVGSQKLAALNRLKIKLYALEVEERRRLCKAIFDRIGWSPEGRSFADYEFMKWDDVARLNREGLIEFGGHTVNHRIVSFLSDVEAEREIVDSMEDIRRNIGVKPRLFAYPNGTAQDFSIRDQRIVRDYGAIAALSAIEGLNDRSTGLYSLRRYSVGSHTRLEEFALGVSGVTQKLKSILRVGERNFT